MTWRASDVLTEGTGICHAKSNLLAALLRAHGIPTGFGFQRVTVADDDSEGYCLHALVVARLAEAWVRFDAVPGIEFSPTGTQLANPNRPDYDEYEFPGIWAAPDSGTMALLSSAPHLSYAMTHLPEIPSDAPMT